MRDATCFRRTAVVLGGLLGGAVAGCVGTVMTAEGDPAQTPASGSPTSQTPATGVGMGSPPAGGPAVPGGAPAGTVVTTRLARLSHAQWENAVRDLLRLPERPGLAGRFRGDAVLGTFDNNGGALSVDEGLRRDYRDAAELLAEKVTADPAALQRIVPPGGSGDSTGRARSFVETFGRRAYRRPLTVAEVDRHVALFGKGPAAFGGADAFTDGVRLSIEAFLQSAHFLYRAELSPAPGTAPQPLTPWERAAKLSFTIAHTMPDDELLAAAAANDLTSAAAVRRHAERLLATPGALDVLESFHVQLLRLGTYDQIEKDTASFPAFVPGLGADMRRETTLFAREVVGDGGGLHDLLLSPRTFVNQRLAAIYEVPAPATPFAPVALDPARRGGLLTQLGFLAANAHAREVDSIHRGVFVHGSILCTELPPPVDGVSLSGAKGRTNRERIASITGDGTCGAGCHSKVINPVGFAFEHYDAIGRYRTTDGGYPVDSAGSFVFDGTERAWTNAVEFSRLAAESQTAHDCYARHLFEYVHGRVPETADRPRIEVLGRRSRADKAATRALVLDLVTSEDFLSRPPSR